MEICELKWTRLLISWLNKCVVSNEVDDLSASCLVQIIDKYKEDICRDDIDKAILCTDDVEPFINYKFPSLRLRYLSEAEDYPKKLYIITSVLLFYCCMNSKYGQVDEDICEKLDRDEQGMILKFCEVLKEIEATINNVETAIKAACEDKPTTVVNLKERSQQDDSCSLLEPSSSIASSGTSKVNLQRTTVLQFKSSVTVLPSKPQIILRKTTRLHSQVALGFSQCCDFCYKAANPAPWDRNNYQFFELCAPSISTSAKCDSLNYITTDTSLSSISEVYDLQVAYARYKRATEQESGVPADSRDVDQILVQHLVEGSLDEVTQNAPGQRNCLPDCACSRCSASGPCCADPGCTQDMCKEITEAADSTKRRSMNRKGIGIACLGFLLVVMIVLSTIPLWKKMNTLRLRSEDSSRQETVDGSYLNHETQDWLWECSTNFCQKVFRPTTDKNMHTSLSRCTLLCMGPQLWPYPIGYTYFSKTIVALSTKKLEYKFQSVSSDTVQQYLAEAFKLFLKDLVRLEKVYLKTRNRTQDLPVKKMIIQMEVESDTDPKLRLNTEEAYTLKVETTNNQVLIKINSVSFCGVRHGLETLSQVILLEQSTGHLITLSNMIIKDAPSYKYRGLMIDTGRNYIPVVDLMRTLDAMATCKLNTFHWRISDVTSFPWQMMKVPEFAEYGPYDKDMVYTKEDVKTTVKRANVRGIRVLIEVASPGPVGRPWSWSSETTCPKKNDNFTCDNVLCLRLKMQESVFDILQAIYSEILEMTNVDDVFHLSDGVFSLTNCYYLVDDREGFLDKALVRLKLANKGFLPKLPIIWYTSHLTKNIEAQIWDRLGVQLNDWDPNPLEHYLSKFKVIHSTKWDLSCEMRKQRCTKYRTWQQMYSWKSWRNVDVFTIEGGETVLWTDLVDSSNLDYHLWPRAAAVAERLWSDMVANSSANKFVYMRLDTHRWRMLLRGVKVQPIWPAWCSFHPNACLEKVQ